MDKKMLDFFMLEAVKLAKTAFNNNEVPIGAIVVLDNRIIGRGFNQTEKKKNIVSHAELIAIKKAQKYIMDWRLNNAILFSTVEPCIMCTYASILSRIGAIVYGTKNNEYGGAFLIEQLDLKNKINIIENVLGDEAKDLMQRFFIKARKKGEVAESG